MATLVTPARKNIFVEGARSLSAVSEELIQRIAASINFINLRQYQERELVVNGRYNAVALPLNYADGRIFFNGDTEIVEVWMAVDEQTGATAGYTEWDLEYQTAPGGAWTSIFTTKPRIDWNAVDGAYIHLGSAVANTTAPVLALTDLPSGSSIRGRLIAAPTGSFSGKSGTSITLQFRPR